MYRLSCGKRVAVVGLAIVAIATMIALCELIEETSTDAVESLSDAGRSLREEPDCMADLILTIPLRT